MGHIWHRCLVGEPVSSAGGGGRTAGRGLRRGRHQAAHLRRQGSVLDRRARRRGGETEPTEAAAAVAGDADTRGERGAGDAQRACQDLHRQQQQPGEVPPREPVLRQPRRRQVLREARPASGVRRLRARTVRFRADQCEQRFLCAVYFYFLYGSSFSALKLLVSGWDGHSAF